MLKPVRTADPAALTFLTLAEAKAHCRIDDADNDGLITNLISAVESYLDGYSGILGRALINQTWRVNLIDWPCDVIRLPMAPVSAITSIKYYDDSNVQQTVTASDYSLHEDALSPYVKFIPAFSAPGVYDRDNAIEVLFVAGYGSAASNVPAAIRAAALLLVGHWYENRENVVIGQTVVELPMAVNSLLAPFRRVGF
jgi:uncharacterized phiE125 gp8 family phage protein